MGSIRLPNLSVYDNFMFYKNLLNYNFLNFWNYYFLWLYSQFIFKEIFFDNFLIFIKNKKTFKKINNNFHKTNILNFIPGQLIIINYKNYLILKFNLVSYFYLNNFFKNSNLYKMNYFVFSRKLHSLNYKFNI